MDLYGGVCAAGHKEIALLHCYEDIQDILVSEKS